MRDPARDPWPSVEDRTNETLCPWCEALPTEPHAPSCPLYAPTFDDLAWCDECGQAYVTTCGCG